MKRMIFVLATMFSTMAMAQTEKSWVLIEEFKGQYTNSYPNEVIPDDMKLLSWDNNGERKAFMYQGFRRPRKFPAMVYRYEKRVIVNFFKTIAEGKEFVMRESLALGPEVSLHALEAPYVVLTTTNGPGVGVAADANGDLVTWTEHASPWNADVASSNRVAALGARNQLLSDTRDLKVSVTNNIADEQAIPIEVSTNAVKQLRKELIDLGQDVKVLRGIVARMLKQNE